MMLQCRAKEKDMAELFGKKYTNRTRFTRMCIGEAVFSLMDKKSYEEIRVSDIVDLYKRQFRNVSERYGQSALI